MSETDRENTPVEPTRQLSALSLPRFLLRGLGAGVANGVMAGATTGTVIVVVPSIMFAFSHGVLRSALVSACALAGFVIGWAGFSRTHWSRYRLRGAILLAFAGGSFGVGADAIVLPLLIRAAWVYGGVFGVVPGMLLGPLLAIAVYLVTGGWFHPLQQARRYYRAVYTTSVGTTASIVLLAILIFQTDDWVGKAGLFLLLGPYFALWSIPFAAYLVQPYVVAQRPSDLNDRSLGARLCAVLDVSTHPSDLDSATHSN